MLFSDKSIAKYVNENFEPAWESVRPVPVVTIDFGNGNKIKRTLHGNIATYICTNDGTIVDILPGLYKPSMYLKALEDIRTVAKAHTGQIDRLDYIKQYHKNMLTSEYSLKPAVQQHSATTIKKRAIIEASSPSDKVQPPAGLVSNVVSWSELNYETAVNQTIRRRQIHSKLAQSAKTTPAQIRNWLYKEVLHCDLDDSYLGLKSALFDNYPFID